MMRCAFLLIVQMGETQTTKRSSNVFRVLDFYIFFDIFTRVALCWRFFLNSKLDDDDDDIKILHEF